MPGDPPFHPAGPFPGPGGFPAQLQHVPVSHHIPVADPRFESLFKVPTMVNAASPLLSPSGGDMLHKHCKFNICLLPYFIISFFTFHSHYFILHISYFHSLYFILQSHYFTLHTS